MADIGPSLLRLPDLPSISLPCPLPTHLSSSFPPTFNSTMSPATISPVASYKARLSRIASEVHDDPEELRIAHPAGAAASEDSPDSARRSSHRSARSSTSIGSPVANGADSGAQEIAKYKQDIEKLLASEAEIKALSFNYAALLKEKEEQLSRLREENSSLRRGLEANNNVTKDESKKGTADQASQKKVDKRTSNALSNGKEHANMLEESNRSLLAVRSVHETEIKELKAELDKEHENSSAVAHKLQEEHRLNESSQRQLHNLQIDKENVSVELQEMREELNTKILELRKLKSESNNRTIEEPNQSLENMKNMIKALEKENADMKMQRDEIEARLKLCMKNSPEKPDDELDPNGKSSKSDTVLEEMALSIQQLEDALQDTSQQRDKAFQEVARLKQHLLEKELADSDKMDEDDRTIEELSANLEKQKAQILYMEKVLRQEVAKKEEINKLKGDEIQRLNEIIDGLNKRLAECVRTVDLKNDELMNLQTALGQYYAEIDAKDRLRRDLAVAREESAKLSESLKVADQEMEILRGEKEDIATKLSQAERMLSESKHSIQKLEDDNLRIRRALEHSMTTLNRMSLDSDNSVDRRIVIKLLVTYFQRNHSKEVLDLMVRVLGFSEEDKQRIGVAQHAAGKGVVRGVFALPGRLVGGILGGGSPETSSPHSSEKQSFADLWVDFLLKETEERERRESSEAGKMSTSAQDKSTNTTPSSAHNHITRFSAPTSELLPNHRTSSHTKQNHLFEHSESEFATVPLTSSASPLESSYSKHPPRH